MITKSDTITGMFDLFFKSLLYDNDVDMTKWFTSRLFNTNVDNVTIKNSETRITNINSKLRFLDVLLEVDNNLVVLLEANEHYKLELLNARNFGYIAKIYTDYVIKGKSYDIKNTYCLVNITSKLESDKEYDVTNYYIRNDKDDRYLRNFVIIDYNVDKIMEHWYNRDEEVEKYAHIIMLKLNIHEIDELMEYKNLKPETREYVIRYGKEFKRMAKEKDWWEPWHTPEEEEELILNTERDIAMRKGRAEGIEEGMEKGHAKGIEEANISAVQNMARENISADVISRCVKMPLEKVNKILASITL